MSFKITPHNLAPGESAVSVIELELDKAGVLYKTFFSVGSQHFELANGFGEDGKKHCEFIARMFENALWERDRYSK